MTILEVGVSTYAVADAKTHLSPLIDEALYGEIVTITRHGMPGVQIRARARAPQPVMDRYKLEWLPQRRESRPAFDEPAVDILRRMRDSGERRSISGWRRRRGGEARVSLRPGDRAPVLWSAAPRRWSCSLSLTAAY